MSPKESLCPPHDPWNIFSGKRILVTGGTGSIGSELILNLVSHGASRVLAMGTREASLERLRQRGGSKVEPILADVRDYRAVLDAVSAVDYVIHAAALKHVPLGEEFPYEYVKTNVKGTYNVVEASIKAGVERLVFVSSVKAVYPSSVIGATKLLGERIITAKAKKLDGPPFMASIRLGNVLDTRGNVVEIFLQQAKKSRELTVTDPNMTRFALTTKDAIELIAIATSMAKKGEVFVAKMPAMKIGDLAEAVIRVAKDDLGIKVPGIKVIGKRPGEELHESALSKEEAYRAVECNNIITILPNRINGAGIEVYTTLNARKLTIEELITIIRKILAHKT